MTGSVPRRKIGELGKNRWPVRTKGSCGGWHGGGKLHWVGFSRGVGPGTGGPYPALALRVGNWSLCLEQIYFQLRSVG